jgi:hypothetical protein
MFRTVIRRTLPCFAGVAVLGSLALSGGLASGAAASAGRAAVKAPHGVYGNFELSNWGGYVANESPGSFTTATARWTEANATCRKKSEYYAPWVGIDGWNADTVEQTGVQTACSTGKPVDTAWYEMFPKAPVFYSNPVSTGDKITATVTASGDTYTMTISDLTKGWTETTTKSNSNAESASAEAVIEAPGGYPTLKAVKFTGVEFNGTPLDDYSLIKRETDTNSPITYTPTAITNGDDFKMVPES